MLSICLYFLYLIKWMDDLLFILINLVWVEVVLVIVVEALCKRATHEQSDIEIQMYVA